MKKRYKYPLILLGVAFAAAAAGFVEGAAVNTNQKNLVAQEVKTMSGEAIACMKSNVAPARSETILFNRYADRLSYVSASAEKSFREEAKRFANEAMWKEASCRSDEMIRVMLQLQQRMESLSKFPVAPLPGPR